MQQETLRQETNTSGIQSHSRLSWPLLAVMALVGITLCAGSGRMIPLDVKRLIGTDEATIATPLMFEVTITDEPGQLVPVFFDRANLDSSKAFVVDSGKIDGLFIWLGKDTLNQTKAFTDAANTYDQRNSRGLDIIDEKGPDDTSMSCLTFRATVETVT